MEKRQLLNDNDVISVEDVNKVFISHKTFTLEEFLQATFKKFFGDEVGKRWLFEGVPCQTLSPGKSWRKGKVKITIEFIADEPESPLDEIRREIAASNLS